MERRQKIQWVLAVRQVLPLQSLCYMMGYDGCYSLHQLYHNLIKKLLVGWFGQLLRKSMSQGWVANTLLAVVYDCAICLLRVGRSTYTLHTCM